MMRTEFLVHGEVRIGRGETLRIENGEGVAIGLWSGALWITQEGDARDVFLSPGDWFRLDRRGMALVHASHDSCLALTRVEEAPRARSRLAALGAVLRGWLGEPRPPLGNLCL